MTIFMQLRRRGGVVMLAISVVTAALVGLAASPAAATVAPVGGADFPSVVTVGQSGLPATLFIQNQSSGTEATQPLVIETITVIPSCGNGDQSCVGGGDPGVFSYPPIAVGQAGTGCAGRTFNVVLVDAATGKVAFTPTSPPLVLGTPGTPGERASSTSRSGC